MNDCPRQDPAYRPTHLIQQKARLSLRQTGFLFFNLYGNDKFYLINSLKNQSYLVLPSLQSIAYLAFSLAAITAISSLSSL